MTSDASPEELILWIMCPVVFLFGMVGNVITLIVMYRLRHHFLTFAYYFAALSLSDSILLVFSMLPRWAESLTKLRFEVKDHLMCKIDAVVHYAAFIASSWFLAGLAAHRAAVVLWPYSVGSPYAQPVAKLLVIMVAASSGLLAFFMLSRDDMNFEDCYFGSAIKLNHKGLAKVWTWVDSTLIFFLPCIVIVGANVVIILHLIASDDQVSKKNTHKNLPVVKSPQGQPVPLRRRVAIEDSGEPDVACLKRHRKSFRKMSITFSIIWASAVFCVLLGPGFIVEALVTTDLIPEHRFTPVVCVVLEVMEYTNAAVNFYLYCLTGERFRNEIKNIRYITLRRRSSEPEEEESGGQTPILVLSLHRVDSSCSRSSILKKTRSTSSVRKTVSFQDEMTAFIEDKDAHTLTFPLQPLQGDISQTETVESPVDNLAEPNPDGLIITTSVTVQPELVDFDADPLPPVVIWRPNAEREDYSKAGQTGSPQDGELKKTTTVIEDQPNSFPEIS